MSDAQITKRKDHHIDIVLREQVSGFSPALGLDRYTLEYDALPEISLNDVDLSCTVLGRPLQAPIIIGAMTGGSTKTGQINRILARAAARVGVGMALGSQRAMLVDPSVTSSFQVRDAAPDLPLLIGNVGAVQLVHGLGLADLKHAVNAVNADALNLHLNPLQEAVQPEGDVDFRGISNQIRMLVPQLGVPVIIKEVGAGLSERTLHKLRALPIAGVEVAGTGGTSWAAVEHFRAAHIPAKAAAGEALAGFGVPTAQSLQYARAIFADHTVIASGGIRHAMDIAVAIALGADAVAISRPMLQAAMQGEDAVVDLLNALVETLRIIAFCCGASTAEALKTVRVLDQKGL